MELPVGVLQMESIREMFCGGDVEGIFTEEELNGFLKYLPTPDITILERMLKGENFHFGNPMDIFTRQLKKGVFTELW